MKPNRIFLDLDGVIRDWCDGIFKLFDCEPVPVTSWDSIVNYVCKLYGISKTYFWERQDKEFWVGLKMFPWARELIDLLPYRKVCILTSPTLTSAGYNQAWIKKYLPEFFNDKKYLIGPAKHFCADKYSVLIDDSDKNIDMFAYYGGHTILFPQLWNKNNYQIGNEIEYVKNKLNNMEVI